MSGGTFGGGQYAWGTPSDSDQPAGFTAALIRDQEEVQIVLYVEIWLHNFNSTPNTPLDPPTGSNTSVNSCPLSLLAFNLQCLSRPFIV